MFQFRIIYKLISSCRTEWTRKWLLRRKHQGFYDNLMQELRLETPKLYNNFLRLNYEAFEEILIRIRPSIQKMNTNMREVIKPEIRLAVTLRYLATGETFASLAYQFRVSFQRIRIIVPETCEAIYMHFKNEYLHVCTHHLNCYNLIQ